ncbi:MAG TPA: hypothetical protein VF998_07355 [Candidatus Limnocylindria bacterium]
MRSRPPITRDLSLAYLVSLLVALIMTIASLAGLVAGTSIYPDIDVKLFPLFVGQDALNVLVGLPILLGSMWLARRGSLIGLLLWPGALFYVVYDYGYYVLGAPFNWFFLPYIALMTLGMYAAIAVVVSVDADAVRGRLTGSVPARPIGGFLIGLALLFTTLWAAMTLSALAGGSTLDPIARVVTILDLTLQLPALFLAGILVWRRRPIAYVITGGLLLQAAAYLIGLSAITVLQEVVIGGPFEPVAIVPGLVVGALCLIAIGAFVRGAARPTELSAPPARSALEHASVR